MPKKKLRRNDSLTSEPQIEIIDDAGKTLLIMPQSHAVRQRLRHRTVLVCLRNAKGLVYLFKTQAIPSDESKGDVWVPAAHGRVFAGESRHAAATRLLEQSFGVSGVDLFEAAMFSSPTTEGFGNITVTLFLTAKTSVIPRSSDQDGSEGIFVDSEEFNAIAHTYPHMLTPFWNQTVPYLFLPDPRAHT